MVFKAYLLTFFCAVRAFILMFECTEEVYYKVDEEKWCGREQCERCKRAGKATRL